MSRNRRLLLIIVTSCAVYSLLRYFMNYVNSNIYISGKILSINQRPYLPGASSDVFDQCRLVSAPLWTDSIRKLLNPDSDPMKSCNRTYLPWSELRSDGRVQLTEAWNKNSDCRARPVLYKTDYQINMGKWHKISEDFVFENDIVQVECKTNNSIVYDFMHYQIWRNSKPEKPKKNMPPSVHIIVLDSIGASHGRRVFNQTYRFLKEEFDAVEFLHMNKVLENSLPNAMAFLFGKLHNDIDRQIFGMPSVKADWTLDEYCRNALDDKGFILERFEKNGYVTMRAQDYRKGDFYPSHCKGFRKQPANHYMRPFQVKFDQGGRVMRNVMRSKNCFETHLFLNDYQEKFIKSYPDVPKASLTWTSYLGHDSIDNPFHTDIQYKEFFERNKEEFDNSFVFFMADHGFRFGMFPRDPIGKRDINNPMLTVTVPRWLRKDQDLMSNLKRNSRELLSMFDTYATLVDIAETFSRKGPTKFEERLLMPELRGSSLLRPLPEGPRNCKTLPFQPQYCICDYAKTPLNVSDRDAIGEAAATFLNKKLADANVSSVCAELKLEKLLELQRVEGNRELYDVTVQLKPGGGIFHTIVRGLDGDFSVIVPDLPRFNLYGNKGNCLKHEDFRSLCYCKSFLTKEDT